ncbi:hypothetical protein thsps21_15160 [Pseudomonas sp. No.21]|uniref:hypothetical protein n=1 Tax=Pseudomonas tohonis TaxID=2725477 RepID=UPI001F2295A9|nr:hypothetical protein [Pseudomonas tohonis]GJN44682.1 hypothetical protein TUM20249_06680 [Pseudomonas tohonis]
MPASTPMLILHVGGELLLASACLLAAWLHGRERQGWRAAGFVSMALAALFGAALYAGLGALDEAHRQLAFISSRIGLPLIAFVWLRGATRHLVMLGLAAAMLLAPPAVALAGNALALATLAWPGRSRRWGLAVAGSLAFLLAGLVIGTQGDWLGIPRVDLFHLCLATAVLAWIGARLRG